MILTCPCRAVRTEKIEELWLAGLDATEPVVSPSSSNALVSNRIFDTYFPAGPSGALISSFYDNMP